MRRLAKQSREDSYASNRDYQTVEERRSARLTPRRGAPTVVFRGETLTVEGASSFAAGGAFVKPERDVELTLTVNAGGEVGGRTYSLTARRWNRAGLAIEQPADGPITVTMAWDGGYLDCWGLDAGRVVLPGAIDEVVDAELLSATHMSPETFYFPHDTPVALDVIADETSRISIADGDVVTVKKCAYCQRSLPLDPRRPGTVSFHKHNAKRTKRQNECRVCKKWRINDSFNVLRTVDQLHESSVITRERKMFLREPEILQRVKERDGAGLKSQVWERYGRRCFYCKRELELAEFELDHTRPLAYLWPIDEHATCLCGVHNNAKKEKFPVDFYSDDQLRELSAICGLSYDELRKRELNERELQHILDDLPGFAMEWEPRHFAATARKIAELRPDIDLYALLRERDEAKYVELRRRLEERPPSVGEDIEE